MRLHHVQVACPQGGEPPACDLDAEAARLRRMGCEVDESQRHTFAGFERPHTFDTHGDRVELLAAADSGAEAGGPIHEIPTPA
jgi:hypothetical protein